MVDKAKGHDERRGQRLANGRADDGAERSHAEEHLQQPPREASEHSATDAEEAGSG